MRKSILNQWAVAVGRAKQKTDMLRERDRDAEAAYLQALESTEKSKASALKKPFHLFSMYGILCELFRRARWSGSTPFNGPRWLDTPDGFLFSDGEGEMCSSSLPLSVRLWAELPFDPIILGVNSRDEIVTAPSAQWLPDVRSRMEYWLS